MNIMPLSLRARQFGVTMIELLVAMIIGLLGTVVIFTVFQNAEGYKRTTIGVGDAQTNGAVALFSLERYIRTSGSALTTTNESQPGQSTAPVQPNQLLGCPLFGLPNNPITRPAAAAATPVAPVRIVDGSQTGAGAAAWTSDVIVIMAGNSDIATNPTLTSPIPAGSNVVNITESTYGWRPPSATRLGDIALFANGLVSLVGAAVPTFSAQPCTARRIRQLAAAFGPGPITLNAPTPAVNYTPSANAHNIGPTPYFLSIGINAQQQLVQTNFTPLLTGEGGAAQQVIADGIISLQAQYGIDTNQDDVIDAWVEPTGAWANPITINRPATPPILAPEPPAINQIKAIRLAILARSAQFEAPDRTQAPPVCNVSAVPPGGWFLLPQTPAPIPAGALIQPQGVDIQQAVINSGPTLAANANWACFRYRRFETVIPILNMIRSPL